jgi:thermostable 8-oxoguanine DNA glycosylase
MVKINRGEKSPLFNIVSPDPNIAFTDTQLQLFILFSIAVAGKTAKVQEKAIYKFLTLEKGKTPFDKLRKMLKKGTLRENLIKARLGKYTLLEKAYTQLAISNINLRKCTIEALESIKGVGFKTSRFFLLHSRKNIGLAALDTHVLKFLREFSDERKIDIIIPKTTPGSKNKYEKLEQLFLGIAKEQNTTPQELDYKIWMKYSKYPSTLN